MLGYDPWFRDTCAFQLCIYLRNCLNTTPPKNCSFAKLFSELNAYWLLICFKRFFFFKYVCKPIFSKTLVTYPIISNSGNILFFIQKNVKTKWPHVNSVWKQNSALPSIDIWFRLNYKCERFIRFENVKKSRKNILKLTICTCDCKKSGIKAQQNHPGKHLY